MTWSVFGTFSWTTLFAIFVSFALSTFYHCSSDNALPNQQRNSLQGSFLIKRSSFSTTNRRTQAGANKRTGATVSVTVSWTKKKEEYGDGKERKRELARVRVHVRERIVITWVNDTRVRSQSTLITTESVSPVAVREWFIAGEKGFESANATTTVPFRSYFFCDDRSQFNVTHATRF